MILLLVPEYYHKRTMIVASIYPAGGRGLHRGRSQFGSKPVPVNTQPTSQANFSVIEKEKSTQVNLARSSQPSVYATRTRISGIFFQVFFGISSSHNHDVNLLDANMGENLFLSTS